MLVSVLAKQRFGHCATCNVETDVWVCTYDHVPDRGGLNHQIFCDDDIWAELEYIVRLGVPINDERDVCRLEDRAKFVALQAAAVVREEPEPEPL